MDPTRPCLPVTLLLIALLAPLARPGEISIEVDEAAESCVIEGAVTLAGTLEKLGHDSPIVAPGAGGSPLTVVVGVIGDVHLEGLLGNLEDEPGPDAFYLTADSDDLLVIAGGGGPGALYGCLAAARLAVSGELFKAKAFAPVQVFEQPAFATRAVTASLRSPWGGDRPLRRGSESWFYDPSFWEDYLDRLALWRFNTLLLDIANPLAALLEENVIGGRPPSDGQRLSKAEAAANRAALAAILEACGRHGITLLLGLDPFTLPVESDRARRLLETALGDLLGSDEPFGLGLAADRVPAKRLEKIAREVLVPVFSPFAEGTRLLVSSHVEAAEALRNSLQSSGLELITLSGYNAALLASSQVLESRTVKMAAQFPHHVAAIHASNISPLRCCAPAFLAGCARTMKEAAVDGLMVGSLSPFTFPYAADRTDPPLLAHDRDWIWYEAWSRYAWKTDRPEAEEKTHWETLLGARFGDIKAGRAVYAALDAGGRILPRLTTGFAPRPRSRGAFGEGEHLTFLLGAPLEQLMFASEGLFASRPGETPRSSIMRQMHGEPPSREPFFGILDQVVAMANTVWEKINDAGRWVSGNREEFKRLAGDLMLTRQVGLVWWDRTLAAYEATAYVQQGGESHRRALSGHLHDSLDEFADLCVLLDANYREIEKILAHESWPAPLLPAANPPGRLLEQYRTEYEVVQGNIKQLEDPATAAWMQHAIREKIFLDMNDALAGVPGTGEEPREGSWLILDTGLWRPGAQATDGYTLDVIAKHDGRERRLLRTAVTSPGWTTHVLALGEEAGRKVCLSFQIDANGSPPENGILLGNPRVVSGRLPSRTASWALPTSVIECASLITDFRNGRMEETPANGPAASEASDVRELAFTLQAGSYSSGSDSHSALLVRLPKKGTDPVALEMAVSVPPPPGPSVTRLEPPLTLADLVPGPGAHTDSTDRTGGVARLILEGRDGCEAWAATPQRLIPRGPDTARARIVVDATLAIDRSEGAQTILGLGTEAAVVGAPLGPSYELVAIGRGADTPPEWHARWRRRPEPGGMTVPVVGNPTQSDTRITLERSLGTRDRRVLLVLLPEGGVAGWIMSKGESPAALPSLLDPRPENPQGRVYVRHLGPGRVEVQDIHVTMGADSLTVVPAPSAMWPPGLEDILAPWSARAAELAGVTPAQPHLARHWLEMAAARRATLAARLCLAARGSIDPPPMRGRTVYETPILAIEQVSVTTAQGTEIPAHLYLPRTLPPPYPLAVIIPPIPGGGKARATSVWPAVELARHGLAAVVFDPAGLGERAGLSIGGPRLQPAGISSTGTTLAEVHAVIAAALQRREISQNVALLGLGPASSRLALWSAAVDPTLAAVAIDSPLRALDQRLAELGTASTQRALDSREAAGWVEAAMPLGEAIGLVAPRPLLMVTEAANGPGEGHESPAKGVPAGRRLAAQIRPFWHIMDADDDLEIVERKVNSVGFRADLVRRIATFLRRTLGLDQTTPLAGKIPRSVADWDAISKAVSEPIGPPRAAGPAAPESASGRASPILQQARKDCQSLPPAVNAAEIGAYTAEVRSRLVEALGAPMAEGPLETVPLPGWMNRLGAYPCEGFLLRSADGRQILALLTRPNTREKPAVALAVSERGLEAAIHLPDVTELLEQGVAVCAVGLAGQDFTASPSPSSLAILAGAAGTTLLRRWIDDIHLVLNHLVDRADIFADRPLVIGEGAAGVAALLAAVEDERLGGVVMRETIVSFKALCESGAAGPLSEAPHPALGLPDILAHLDIDQAACALGPRPLVLIDPVDGRRQALDEAARRLALSATRQHGWTPLQIEVSRH